ncbi:MAG: homoserine dehydrogenase [Acidimicrobiales bacterium]
MPGRPVPADVVRVGLLGAGTVGGALVNLLGEESAVLASSAGVRLELARVAVSDLSRARGPSLPAALLTDDPFAVVSDPGVDVVVELMGGVEPARELVLAALRAGKPVVTANKELLATSGGELFETAAKVGVDLLFEAAVGGAIPLVRPLRESLAGERLSRVMGIVNGTTNYVLTKMSEGGVSYEEALSQAQELGYAERDPTADVEGHDAAAKAAILASLAFGAEVLVTDVAREGISRLRAEDVAFARRQGYEVKLLAVAERLQDPAGGTTVSVRVHPAMVPRSHPLASVRDAHNAVFIEGPAIGELMLYGRGAGGAPTAAAVLGDLIDAAHNLRQGSSSRLAGRERARMHPAERLTCAYSLGVDVLDRPGVLASVAGVFGSHDVSIRSMEQVGLGDEARMVFVTHLAVEADMSATLEDLEALDAVRRVGALLRVVD